MKLVAILILFCSFQAQAIYHFSKKLSASDRQLVLQSLIANGVFKNSSDPYPLGGDLKNENQGIELSFSQDWLPSPSVAGLGDGSGDTSSLASYNFTLGKGLYNDLDFFFQFSPNLGAQDISAFGGMLRWMMYESSYAPIFISMQLGATNLNYFNLVTTQNLNFDLILGLELQRTTIFFGTGQVRSRGNFAGGADGVTDDGTTDQNSVSDVHSFAGLSYKLSEWFIGIQAEHAYSSAFNFKVGYRF